MRLAVVVAPAALFSSIVILHTGSIVEWSDQPGSKQKGSVTALAPLPVRAQDAVSDEQAWTGAISDKMCGADHKKMGGSLSDRDCTLACAKGGSPYVLIAGGKVYALANHESDLQTHAGHTVRLTGGRKGDTLRVSKIEMPKP